MEKFFSIDPNGLKAKDVIFNAFVIDNNRNIFLLDGRSVKIYKFNRKKNLEKVFLSKGKKGTGNLFYFFVEKMDI